MKKGGVSDSDKNDEEAKNNAVNSDVIGIDEERPVEYERLKTTVISKAVGVEPGLRMDEKDLTQDAELDIQDKPRLNDDERNVKQEQRYGSGIDASSRM